MKAVISLMCVSKNIENPYSKMYRFIYGFCRYRLIDITEYKRKMSKNGKPVIMVYVDNWKREYLPVLLKRVNEKFNGKVRVLVRVLG